MAILLCGEFDPGEREAWLAALSQALPGEQLLDRRDAVAAEAIDVAVVANPPPGALQGLPCLRLIQSLWAGVDRLLDDPTLPPEVPLARMVDPAMNQAMAETALWAVLGLQRDLPTYARQQRAQQWQPHPQRRADEWPVLVLGLGEMGRTVATRLALNGYPVSGWSRRPHAVDRVQALHGEAALPAALAAARVVVNLLPLTPATRGFFDASRFAAFSPGAHLVNLARGAHLVEADALAALASGRLGELVLDVFTQEPLPPDHPFWHHPRVTVLPHVAAQTDLRSAATVAADNVRRLRRGEPLQHRVDRGRGY
jgi:glyoxylate/hydroxypyruvate reductase A